LRCCQRDHAQRFRSAGEAVSELAKALGITEGPQLVVDVTDILQQVRAAEGASPQTLLGAPIAPIAAQSGAPLLTPPSPVTITPAGSSGIHATAAMGSTMLASETSAVPLGQTNSSRGSSNKLVAMVAGGVLVVGLIGVGAFLGLSSKGSRRHSAKEGDPAPLALPSSMQQPQEKPTVTTVAADTPSPSTTEMPVASTTASAVATTAPTIAAPKSTSKSAPTGTTKTTTKKSNDDDLMSGRK